MEKEIITKFKREEIIPKQEQITSEVVLEGCLGITRYRETSNKQTHGEAIK